MPVGGDLDFPDRSRVLNPSSAQSHPNQVVKVVYNARNACSNLR
jgi:hypothetical protein